MPPPGGLGGSSLVIRPSLGSFLILVLLLAGCSQGRDPLGSGQTPSEGTATASQRGSASPFATGTATGTAASTPGTTAPGTPGATSTEFGSSSASVTCPTINPIRVTRAETAPRRTTEVVTIVSDGSNLTSGTREQLDFLTPTLIAPDGATSNDQAALTKITNLIAGQKHRVLLTRPDAPDVSATTTKKPYSQPGTYVAYNASSQLTASVVVQCAGDEMIWTFIAEADPSTGQVNCAIEPAKSNAMARLIYQNNC